MQIFYWPRSDFDEKLTIIPTQSEKIYFRQKIKLIVNWPD
jgi:hypothetical protein